MNRKAGRHEDPNNPIYQLVAVDRQTGKGLQVGAERMEREEIGYESSSYVCWVLEVTMYTWIYRIALILTFLASLCAAVYSAWTYYHLPLM